MFEKDQKMKRHPMCTDQQCENDHLTKAIYILNSIEISITFFTTKEKTNKKTKIQVELEKTPGS